MGAGVFIHKHLNNGMHLQFSLKDNVYILTIFSLDIFQYSRYQINVPSPLLDPSFH